MEKVYYLVRKKDVFNKHLKYCKLFVALLVGVSACIFYLEFFGDFPKSFLCMQIKQDLFLPEIVFFWQLKNFYVF